jgi:hypothetical protein
VISDDWEVDNEGSTVALAETVIDLEKDSETVKVSVAESVREAVFVTSEENVLLDVMSDVML